MKNLKIINFENASDKEMSAFQVRDTARAVIFDADGKIALMKVSRESFHKLPGGGIEDGENVLETLRRECLEEAGVEIEEPAELVVVKEIKKTQGIVQNSFCYTARMTGRKGIPQFTASEKENGFETIWVEIGEAIRLIKNDGCSSIAGKYIVERELAILDAAAGNNNLSISL